MQGNGEERKGTEPPTVAAEDARVRLGELMLRAGYGEERIVLTRHGKPIAALIGLRDLEKLVAA